MANNGEKMLMEITADRQTGSGFDKQTVHSFPEETGWKKRLFNSICLLEIGFQISKGCLEGRSMRGMHLKDFLQQVKWK